MNINLNQLDNTKWKEIIDQIDEKTGEFKGRKILAIKDDKISFFSSTMEALLKNYKPVNSEWLLQKSIIYLKANDRVEQKKLLSCIEHEKLTVNYIKIKYQDVIESSENFQPSELLNIAIEAYEYYNEFQNPEILKLVHKLLDLAVEKSIQNNNINVAHHARVYQLGIDKPNLQQFCIDPKKWNSNEGQYFDQLDSGKIKQGCLHIASLTNQHDQKVVRLDFKLTYPEREKLTIFLNALSKMNKEGLTDDFKVNNNVNHIYFSKNDPNISYSLGKITEVEVKNIGKITAGESKQYGSLYNHVFVEIESTDSRDVIEKSFKLLTLIGLGSVLNKSDAGEEERKKLMLIYRTFFPKECFITENKINTYNMDVNELRKNIEKDNNNTKEIFSKYLDKNSDLISKKEVFSGFNVFEIKDLANLMKKEGAVCLFRGIQCYQNDFSLIPILLKNGQTSGQDRLIRGTFNKKYTSTRDHGANSADQIFTRLITVNVLECHDEKMGVKRRDVKDFPLSGNVQFIIDLEALNKGFYGFSTDNYGNKNRSQEYEVKLFQDRKNPLELTRYLNENILDENELMIKNFIAPEHFKCIIVQEEQYKTMIIEEMKKANIIILDHNKECCIIGKNKIVELEKFIYVTKHLQKEMLK